MTALDQQYRSRTEDASGRRAVSDRVRRRQRREHRLRRTALLVLVLLLAGTAIARWREDPGSVAAGGLRTEDVVAAALTSSPSAVPPDAAAPAVTRTDGSPAPASSRSDGGSGAGAAPASPAPSAPAAGHADSDDGGDQGGALAGSAAAPVPASGTGHLTPVAVPRSPDGTDGSARTGRVVTYGIDVEDGIPVDPAEFAAVVHRVLVDPRGWQTEDGVRFVPVSLTDRASGADVDIRVTLASPDLTARLCAPLDTSVQQVSCWNGSRSVLNLTRWLNGASTYTDLDAYREYLVSHEVGHGLGHGHASCPARGKPAPVMVQQTKSLEGCTAWPWPTNP